MSNPAFSYEVSFTDPLAALAFSLAPLETCLADGFVVLDTNVLLLPFTTSPHALDEIEKALDGLKQNKRLHIPKHVLREYLANRSGKIKEFHDQLTKKRDKDFSLLKTSKLVERSAYYEQLMNAEKAIKEEVQKTNKIVSSIISEVKVWQTDDPVTEMYRRIISADEIIDVPDEKQKLEKEFSERISMGIPPGNKDEGKPKNNIGDFLIWKSILSLGEKNKGRNVVFVSGDEKPDWVYRSSNEVLYPRGELIEEYRKASEGGSFHLIDFSTLLKHLNASTKTVAEVHYNEATPREAPPATSSATTWSKFCALSESAVGNWARSIFGSENVIQQSGNGAPDFIAIDKDIEHLIEVRAIRHYEHYKKRIREISYQLENIVKSGPIRAESNGALGMIVFVCETSEGAYYIAEAIKDAETPAWLDIRSGFLSEGEFVAAD